MSIPLDKKIELEAKLAHLILTTERRYGIELIDIKLPKTESGAWAYSLTLEFRKRRPNNNIQEPENEQ